jgi:hypothetical protein
MPTIKCNKYPFGKRYTQLVDAYCEIITEKKLPCLSISNVTLNECLIHYVLDLVKTLKSTVHQVHTRLIRAA